MTLLIKCTLCGWYSHPFGSIFVVELHMIACLNPANGPRLFPGYRWHQNSSRGSEVRCPIAQNHAGWLVNAGRVGVNGGVHLQNYDTFTETLWLTPNAVDTAHCIKYQHNPQQRPEVWRRKTHGNSSKFTTIVSTFQIVKKATENDKVLRRLFVCRYCHCLKLFILQLNNVAKFTEACFLLLMDKQNTSPKSEDATSCSLS